MYHQERKLSITIVRSSHMSEMLRYGDKKKGKGHSSINDTEIALWVENKKPDTSRCSVHIDHEIIKAANIYCANTVCQAWLQVL